MAIYRDGELFLYGYVGDNYWDEGFTAGEVLMALAEHGRDEDITVHINSGGGIVDDGIAIYNALAAHKGEVRVEVDAMAASSASIIAMAGDTIVMKAGALMMIHDPANITYGNAADHQKTIEQLEAYAGQMAGIYAERSGRTAEETRADMKEEVWLTSAQAVERGYADEAEASKSKAVAAFDYRLYAKAPKALKTAAQKKGWSLDPSRPPTGAVAPVTTSEEPPMADQNGGAAPDTQKAVADAVKADRDRRRAIMALPEAKDRESLAEHLADTTELSVEAVQATLAKSEKKGGAQPSQAEYEAARTEGAAGAGLGGAPPKPKGPVAIDRGKIFAARRQVGTGR